MELEFMYIIEFFVQSSHLLISNFLVDLVFLSTVLLFAALFYMDLRCKFKRNLSEIPEKED